MRHREGLGIADDRKLFFFDAPAPTEIYTLSLHDALPISAPNPSACKASATALPCGSRTPFRGDRKSTRLNSSHSQISYAVFCLKKKKQRPPAAVTARRPHAVPPTLPLHALYHHSIHHPHL